MKKITSPIDKQTRKELRAGDFVLLSGSIYTARDAAHKRLHDMLESGTPLPLEIFGQTIYYAGPSPAAPGQVIGSCGPTTSSRMDVYTPELINAGLTAMIGKGKRSAPVIEAMKKASAIYLAATGGAGALIAGCIKSCEPVAFEDLLSEAIYRLEVEDMPLIVAVDSIGNDLYQALNGRAERA